MFSANTSQVSDEKLYSEDVFSSFLYTGNGSTQTITNGIDLAGKNGLLWIKNRSTSSDPLHYLNFNDGSNIVSNNSNNTSAKQVMSPYCAFNSNGFFVNAAPGFLNNSGVTYASWTFREAPKFFDVVTYTGDGTNNRSISHNLGIAPGMIIVKNTTSAQSWIVYHRSTGTGNFTILNSTGAVSVDANAFPTVSSTAFVPTANEAAFSLNTSGQTFVAYLFAHDTTSDGIIQCGSYTGTGSSPGPTINLGWEPQWVMIKNAGATGGWRMVDNMRGMTVGTGYDDKYIYANTSGAESSDRHLTPNATGFQIFGTDPSVNTNGISYIYIAIRRGPMRTPTSGTSVFSPVARTGTGATATITSPGFPVDLSVIEARSSAFGAIWFDRLRGANVSMRSYQTDGDFTYTNGVTSFASNTGVTLGADAGGYVNLSGTTYANWFFRRAPSFFDEVCYTGTGVARTVNHNLGVAPELMIVKGRNNTTNWIVYSAATAATNYLVLDLTNASTAWSSAWNNTAPTSSVFTVGDAAATNANGINLVAYLFASCPGVSKVGSYTGNGSSQTINCGFAAGARFVMIKRTDSTGDWYVWDTARGIVAGNDPHLSLNTTAAEVTTDDSVDTDSSGFVVNQLSATNINVSSAQYIYLAVA